MEKGFQSKEKKLFNQLLLCDDFLKFKDLMLKRNRALEEEALRAMRGEPAKASRIQVERSELAQSQKQSQAVKSKLQSEEE